MHLFSNGCPICGKVMGIKEGKWLDYLGLPKDSDYRRVRIYFPDESYIIVDGYDPETETIYEFRGNYHHDDLDLYPPDFVNAISGLTMQELHDDTQDKIRKIELYGYNLIDIWEDDWDSIVRMHRT
jgi:hypothetical protein